MSEFTKVRLHKDGRLARATLNTGSGINVASVEFLEQLDGGVLGEVRLVPACRFLHCSGSGLTRTSPESSTDISALRSSTSRFLEEASARKRCL